MITRHTHVTAQHLSSTFQDFQERRFDETHGGSVSQRLDGFLCTSEEGMLVSFCVFSLDMFAAAGEEA